MKKYEDFLNIYALLFSDFRLVDLSYEDFNKLYGLYVDNINLSFNEQIILFISGNKFKGELIDESNTELSLLLGILVLDNYTEAIKLIKNNKNLNKDFSRFFLSFFELIGETYLNDSREVKDKINLVKDYDFLFHIFSSIILCFRGDKSLKNSISHTNHLIMIRPEISSFYLYRVRNLFLYFYQKIIGHDNFSKLVDADKEKLLNSKYLKQVFSDIAISRKLNPDNPIINLFEGNILLYLKNNKGVELLLSTKGQISTKIYSEYVNTWLASYYLSIKEYSLCEKYIGLSNNKDFKYYRKIIPVCILSNNKDKLFGVFQDLLNNGYKIKFFLRDSGLVGFNQDIIYTKYSLNNEDINIPLDLDNETFLSFFSNINSKNFHLKDLEEFYKYFRKNYHKYFLNDSDISIVFLKSN